MRTMFFYNINMYKKTHNIDVKDDELNICIYLIPDEGIGKKYCRCSDRLTQNSSMEMTQNSPRL